jgi:type I restriction enzyme, S subunit
MPDRGVLDIRADHLDIVRQIIQKHVPNRTVWVFGSRAKGTAKKYSDLDLCILGHTPLTLSEMASLADAFSESDLPYRVDVVDWATSSDAFRTIIERDKILIAKE